jgi:hypothetical protein
MWLHCKAPKRVWYKDWDEYCVFLNQLELYQQGQPSSAMMGDDGDHLRSDDHRVVMKWIEQ